LYQKIHKCLTIYYTCVSINTIVHPDTFRTQVSRLGTGSFILMYSILMKLVLLGAPLNCADANELLSLVRPFDPNRLEMTRVIVAHTDPVCFEDAQVD